MTPPTGPDTRTPDGRGPRASIAVGPVDVTPGQPSVIDVAIRNLGDKPWIFLPTVVGVDPGWLSLPGPVGPLAPGEEGTVAIRVGLPTGFPACDYAAGLRVQAIDPSTGAATGKPLPADLTLKVGDGSLIGASLDPPEVRGGGRGRFHVVLHNRGRSAMRVDLSGSSPSSEVKVRFADPSIVLTPAADARVKARIRARQPVTGNRRRRPFAVRVQGRTTPVLLEGSFTQRPIISALFLKGAALATVVALWGAVAAVGITRLDSYEHKKAVQKEVANAPPPTPPTTAGVTGAAGGAGGTTGSNNGAAAGAGSGAPSAGPGGGSGSSGSGGSGSSGSGGSGSGGSGSGGARVSGGSGGGAAPLAAPVVTRVSGKVDASDPSNVTVSITPHSLVDEQQQGKNFSNDQSGATAAAAVTPSASTAIGKVMGELVSFTAGQVVSSTPKTMTTPDGSWGFAAIPAPGYYLVSFSKPGYATSEYVVTTTADGKPVTLKSSLAPGSGAISGTIFGPGGPLGGADVAITDGTVSLVTRTPTTGAVGTWAIGGLSTPSTYLVTVTSPGLGTQTTVVKLPESGTAKGINLTMPAGLGSITGTVTSAEGPVGGATVTATSGSTTLTVTTTTVNPVGSYTLPNLPIPGVYALTISGKGWMTQTQQVKLTTNAVVNAVLTRTTGDIVGTVTDASTGQGLVDAGVVLSNDQGTFKTLTSSVPQPGSYAITQVPPGHYVLSVEKFQYQTESAEVNIGPGNAQTINLQLPFVGGANQNTATITGHVADLFTGLPLSKNVTFVVDGIPSPSVTANSTGDYSVHNLGPGIHRIQVSAPNYESVTVSVPVGLGGLAFAPPAVLPKLDTLTGVITSNAGGFVTNPVVTVSGPNGPVGKLQPPDPAKPGVYTVTDIPHGTYNVVVSAPDFVTSLPQQITLALATDGTLNVGLDLEPQFQVFTVTPSTGGTLVPLDKVTVTLSDTSPGSVFKPQKQITQLHGTAASTLFTGLIAGDSFEASFSATSPLKSASFDFNAQLNVITADTAVLVAPPAQVMGTLVWTKGDTAKFPVPDSPAPSVQMTAVVGYAFPTPGGPGIPQVQTFVAGMTVNSAFTFPTCQLRDGTQGLKNPEDSNCYAVVSPTADFGVNDVGFQPFSATGVPISGPGQLAPFVLIPNAAPISGSVTLNPAADPSTVAVSVTYADRAAAPVRVVVTDHGSLIWTDSSLGGGTGFARPADYLVSFSKAGYTPKVDIPVSVPLQQGCSACPAPVIITLQKLSTIGGILKGLRGGSSENVANAVITATGPGGPGGTTTRSFSATTDITGSYLLAGDGTVAGQGLFAGRYALKATAFGYTDLQPPPVDIAQTGDDVTKDLSMTAIDVDLKGAITDSAGALNGVGVTALSPVGPPASATTDNKGNYDLGFLPPVQYAVTFSKLTYGTLSLTVNLQVGVSPVIVNGQLLKLVDTITGLTCGQIGTTAGTALTCGELGGPPPLSNVLVEVEDPQTRTVVDKQSSAADKSGNAVYSINGLLDGSYLVVFSAAGYGEVRVNVVLAGGQTFAQDATLVAKTPNLTVTVNSDVGPTALSGAMVTLRATTGSTGVGQGPQSTASDGTTTFNQVVPGSYTIAVDATQLSPAHGMASVAYTVPVTDSTTLQKTVGIVEGELTGTTYLTDTAGTHHAALTVTISGSPSPLTSGTNGSYTVFLPPGTYTVQFSNGPNYSSVTYPDKTNNPPNPAVVIKDGTIITLDPTLVEFGSLTVTVKDSTGAVVTNATVALSVGTTQGPSLTGANSGTDYAFSDLLPGAYTVTATPKTGKAGTGDVPVTAGGAATLTVTLP
jgi:hypothetical protein